MEMSQGFLIIIDDEQDILDLLEYNFLRHGFEVKVFDRALPALNYLSQRKPDMILCDWMMPGMNGLELCKEIKGNIAFSDIPFVMVSCRHESYAKNQALASGATDYIIKPMRLIDLVNRVKYLLRAKNRV